MMKTSGENKTDGRHLPAVAIVGRPNVGKSALFNRLAGRRISIVHDQPGVTRDRLHAVCRLGSRPFQVVDTGGIGSGGVGDGFEGAVEREADISIEIAAVIVLVVDGQTGLTPVDTQLAKRLRRAGKPILLVVNKVDHDKHSEMTGDFTKLGIDPVLGVSAAHGRGIGDLVEVILEILPEAPPRDGMPASAQVAEPIRIALAGRPNVGKSSLLNAILGSARAIVSEVPGTTRDSVDTPFTLDGRDFVLVDTAGLRHQRRHKTSVEVFSAMRSRENIERADLCLLLVDATAGVTAHDKQIAGIIQEAARPCVIAGSKWDLIKPERGAKDVLASWMDETRRGLFFLEYAPIVLLSSVTGENVPRVFREVQRVEAAARRRIGTGVLNRLIEEVQTSNPPPAKSGRRLKILYATAVESHAQRNRIALPGFVLFVNDPALMTAPYLKHIERRIRTVEPFEGLPFVFQIRGRRREDRPARKPKGGSPRSRREKNARGCGRN